jgi:hypothetical protein
VGHILATRGGGEWQTYVYVIHTIAHWFLLRGSTCNTSCVDRADKVNGRWAHHQVQTCAVVENPFHQRTFCSSIIYAMGAKVRFIDESSNKHTEVRKMHLKEWFELTNNWNWIVYMDLYIGMRLG